MQAFACGQVKICESIGWCRADRMTAPWWSLKESGERGCREGGIGKAGSASRTMRESGCQQPVMNDNCSSSGHALCVCMGVGHLPQVIPAFCTSALCLSVHARTLTPVVTIKKGAWIFSSWNIIGLCVPWWKHILMADWKTITTSRGGTWYWLCRLEWLTFKLQFDVNNAVCACVQLFHIYKTRLNWNQCDKSQTTNLGSRTDFRALPTYSRGKAKPGDL